MRTRCGSAGFSRMLRIDVVADAVADAAAAAAIAAADLAVVGDVVSYTYF